MYSLNYDIVLATRNRADVLTISVPLMLQSSRLAKRLIIIDSSDDHELVKRVISKIRIPEHVNLRLISSEKGLTYQRNIGLKYVEAEIVIFPDDDSLWFPNTADEIMKVYEADVDNDIGAVCAIPWSTPPVNLYNDKNSLIKTGDPTRIELRVEQKKDRLSRQLFTDPYLLLGKQLLNEKMVPDWLELANAVPVEYMTGFRMSFRTEEIKKYGFDETLRNYAIGEDIDASFSILKEKLIVGAHRAKVFHYKAPEKRAAGKVLGYTQILNRAYIVCKHTENGDPIRSKLYFYSSIRALLYLIRGVSKYQLERFSGAFRAIKYIRSFIEADKKDLANKYNTASFK